MDLRERGRTSHRALVDSLSPDAHRDREPFRRDYSDWDITYDLQAILREIYEHNVERWLVNR